MVWIILLFVGLVALTVIAFRIYQKEETIKPYLHTKYCRKCGADVETPSAICISCGFDVHNGYNFCTNCGNDTLEGQIQCTGCNKNLLVSASKENDNTLGIISFFIPLVGFIVYGVLYESNPPKAKIAINAAITGIVVAALLFLLLLLL